jgi:hypothetical protein
VSTSTNRNRESHAARWDATEKGHEIDRLRDQLAVARRKLADIREFVQMWQSAAEDSETGDLRMGDIAEVLDR